MISKKPRIAIIGAGIAGLNIARLLSQHTEVVVFEKSDKLCGRMATHEANGLAFDHGAQFFTAKSEAFKQFIQELEIKGVVAQWHARFVEFEPTKILSQRTWDSEFPHYVGVPAMNSIGKYLAQDLDVRFNKLITSIKKVQSHWVLETSESEFGPFDWVVVTVPAEQAHHILPDTFYLKMHLQDVTMQPCFALMLGYQQPKSFNWDAAFVSQSILSWISVNSSKPKRNEAFTIVAMSKNDWAFDHFERQESLVIAEMLFELERITKMKLDDAGYIKLKRWKYANALKKAEPLELIDYSSQLACCGDWCISGRIESAFTSSWQVANKLKATLL
jgi:renalase